jgi:hypothetical protein
MEGRHRRQKPRLGAGFCYSFILYSKVREKLMTKTSSIKILVYVIFSTICLASCVVAQTGQVTVKKFRDRRYRFAFSYPSDLELQRFPDGVSLRGRDMQTLGFDIVISNDPAFFGDDARRPGKYFRRLRKAKPDSVISQTSRDICTKVANVTIDNNPAVRIACSPLPPQPLTAPLPPGTEEQSLPNGPYVIVHLLHGRESWTVSVSQFYIDNSSLQAIAALDRVLATLRFR